MGEPKLELIEQNVKNNVEDIRELKEDVKSLKKDVSDLKSDGQLAKQSITHVMTTLNDLKTGFKELDDKFDKSTTDQLQAYKSFMWKVFAGVVIFIITGFIGTILTLQ